MKKWIVMLLALCLLLTLWVTASADGYGWYVVESTSPYGYAYLYSNASDRNHLSRNLGRYDNGSYVYVINYYGGQDGRYNYCYVRTVDGRVGYMHDYALASLGSFVPSFADIYTPTVTPTPTPVTPQLGTVYITTSSGNARSGPGAEYSQVAYVNYGEVYDVYETRRASNGVTWFKIIVNGRYCWISSGLTNTGKY